MAAEHSVHYLQLDTRQVVGTTYKQLYELVQQIYDGGFFDKAKMPSSLCNRQEEDVVKRDCCGKCNNSNMT